MINFEAFWQTLTEHTVLLGPKILFAFTTLIFGNWIAKTISSAVRRGLEMRKVEPSLVESVGSLIHAALVAFVVIAALSKVSIQTTSFLPIHGAAGLVNSLAFEGMLSNITSEVLNIIFKP